MTSPRYASDNYRQPTVPPGTPPVIDSGADAADAAERVHDDGGSDAPGSQPAHFDRSGEDAALFDGARAGGHGDGGDRDFPGRQPDEVVPGQGDTDVPESSPDEVAPGQGDVDRPGEVPDETRPLPGSTPGETPPPD